MEDLKIPKLPPHAPHFAESSGLMINYAALELAAEGLSTQYQHNSPFPHIVIDNLLPPTSTQRLLDQYPHNQELPVWNNATHRDKQSGEYVQKDKRNIRDLLRMPPAYRQLIWELHSQDFLTFLSRMTGIDNLIPDPVLRGAGIHQIGQGGFLKVHADFATHRDFGLDRRLNFLLYLNPEWPEEYGGHLELWDAQLQGPPKRILPVLNRCVVFNTTATSFHGHPTPLTCPEGVFRKSIALYYYTNGRPAGEAEPGFATLWQDVPDSAR